MSSRLTAQQRSWLLLSHLPQVGPRTLARIISQFASPQVMIEAFATSTIIELSDWGLPARALESIEHWRLNSLTHPVNAYLKQLEDWLIQPQHHLLSLGCSAYPPLLQQIYDPPTILYIVGDVDVLSLPQIAIVGSRGATKQGLDAAYSFSRELSLSGWIPVSGLALGIDGQAHTGALAGFGLTVAVMGTGVDLIYPRRHQQLAEQIVECGGALVSEYSLGMPARGQNFPRRNRIISGLSMATLVVEASLNSGSLITATQAMEQGRDVFAIPGSIHNPMTKGCHQLIRQGASLVESMDHIHQELGHQLSFGLASMSAKSSPSSSDLVSAADSVITHELKSDVLKTHSLKTKVLKKNAIKTHKGLLNTELSNIALSNTEKQLMDTLGYDVQSIDYLVGNSALRVGQVMSLLLELELRGLVRAVHGGYQRV